MRWTLILLTTATLLAFGLIAVAQSERIPTGCTRTGTEGRDIMTGTKHADVLCAEAGDDYLHGDGGRDKLRAGMGNDTVVGAGARDVLRGGRGDDRLFAVDDRGGERVVGGSGRDQCFVDRGDVAFGCETTFRGLSLEVVRGLSRTAYVVMVIAADALSIAPTVPPPPVVTVTTTVISPPCQGPPEPPPIC